MFLKRYNNARKRHNLQKADDWFDFSVPEMFNTETEVEAWHYWRWRILRALVEPAEDYEKLKKITDYFHGKTFVVTSNCDQLHSKSGADAGHLREIHGSLGMLQCCRPCSSDLYPVNEKVIQKLKDENDHDWVPRCPKCKHHCLRPNVMIFGDNALVTDMIDDKERNYFDFKLKAGNNFVVLEIGAGAVVPSIRFEAESLGKRGKGQIRINPSAEECFDCGVDDFKYFGLISTSVPALEGICNGLGL
jgi:NAD-dependent SIR2 family protein deacetylase